MPMPIWCLRLLKSLLTGIPVVSDEVLDCENPWDYLKLTEELVNMIAVYQDKAKPIQNKIFFFVRIELKLHLELLLVYRQRTHW